VKTCTENGGIDGERRKDREETPNVRKGSEKGLA